MQEDVVFLAKWSLNILLQIRTYGPFIRREYGQSYWNQWKGFMYVRFVLRNYPRHYRTRLLFKKSSWQLVNDFVLNHYPLQLELVQQTSLSEYSTINNKFEFFQYCKSKEIQTPEILAVIESGDVTYRKFVEFLPCSSIFVKHLSGGKGVNAKKFDFVDGNYIDNQKNVFSGVLLESKLMSASISDGPIVVQTALKNHASWMNFTPGGLATCRIVTARRPENENIIPLFCCFRLPVGNTVVDNHSRGGIILPIDLDTGKMGVGAAAKPVHGKFEFSQHPDTHHQFEGEILPQWQGLLDFTMNAHKHFKTIFVGWDVCLAEDGFYLIEGNVGWASCSYEIPFQDSLKNTVYPELFEKWMQTLE